MKNLKELIGDNWYDAETMAYYVGHVLGVISEREEPKGWWQPYFDDADPIINNIYDIVGNLVSNNILEAGNNGIVNNNWDPVNSEWEEFRWKDNS